MARTFLITAGGTGGHVFPALSVAKLLIQNGHDIMWVGTAAGIESTIVPKNNIKLATIKMSGLRKKGILKMLFMPFLLCYATLQSISILVRYRPDAIIGFGGYVTFPVLLAGWLLRIPIILHEQNSIPGLSNKILAKLADKVCVAFDGVLPSSKTILVGNPVREDILNIPLPEVRYKNLNLNNPNGNSYNWNSHNWNSHNWNSYNWNSHDGNNSHDSNNGLNVLVLGGSLGAKIFNDVLPEVFAKVTNVASITHQVGRSNVDIVKEKYVKFITQKPVVRINVVNFIDDMAAVYAVSDLIICRGGASTVSEVCAAGIAAIFVPFPYAVDDHQRHNADALVRVGAAQILIQADLTIDKLANMINHMSREDCLKMAKLARGVAIIDSTQRIYNVILSAVN